MRCPRCADAQPEGGRFCSRCGAELAATTPVWQGGAPGGSEAASADERAALPSLDPVMRASRLRRAAPWIVGAMVVCGIGLGAGLLVDRLGDSANNSAAGVADEGRSTATQRAPTTGDAAPATAPSVPAQPAPGTAAPGTAIAALRATASADSPVVEALVGQWVAQVSQRRVGARNSELALPAADIVVLHADLQQRVGAVLLNSSDYVFKTNNMWVSIVPEGFATANEALDRCATLEPADQPCIARLITHDTSIAVTSKQRRS